ncbi:hypothetical protein ACI2KR_08070 [Pseudomonas luteola]
MKTKISLTKVFQKRRLQDWANLSPCFSHVIHDLNGQPIPRSEKLPSRTNSLLPALLDPKRVVTGDLIPFSSWGSSLANLLTRQSWNALRHPLINAHHHVCELCGDKRSSLDVHEIWEYSYPPASEMKKTSQKAIFGIQKLKGLMAICNECHRCFHLGRELAQGTLGQTLERLAALNNWTGTEVDSYHATIEQRWEEANKLYWLLDLSDVAHPDGGLTVATPWALHPKDARFITRPSQFGNTNLTMLLETPWRFESEISWRPIASIKAL